MDLGDPKREVEILPESEPVPTRETPAPEREREVEPLPDLVPA